MRKQDLQRENSWLKRIRRRTWSKVVGMLACVVAVLTVYTLMLPAATLENSTLCGKSEHTHTELCYTQAEPVSRRTQICTLADLGIHQHTDACHDAEGNLLCGYADFVLHRHDAACYDAAGTLVCTLPEIGEHTHTDTCYAPAHTHTEVCYAREKFDLLCALEEAESGHQHTDDCYAWEDALACPFADAPSEPELVCGEAQLAPHTHTAACFDESGLWLCGQLQLTSHQHAEACFQTAEEPGEKQLTCEQEEHTHSQACFHAEPTASAEPSPSVGPDDIMPLAADPGDPVPELTLDTTVSIPVGEKIPFVPPCTHKYNFEAKTQSGSYYYLYDEDMKLVAEHTHNYSSATVTAHLEQGKTYYWQTGWSSNATVKVTMGEHDYQQVAPGQPFACGCGLELEASGECGSNGNNVTWKIEDGVLTISGSGNMANYGYSNNPPWYLFREGIAKIVVEDGVEGVGAFAFKDCANVADVSLPESLRSLGEHAFYNCTGLPHVAIPAGVSSFGKFIFDGCTGLTGVTLPEGLTKLGEYMFYECTALTEVAIPSTVSYISNDAFYKCRALAKVDIAEGVTGIGTSAFAGCKALSEIVIPDTVTSIGNAAFYECEGLTSVVIPDTVTSLGGSVFSDCTNLTSVTLPSGLETIPNGLFNDCGNLTNVNIPEGVTSIGNSAFWNCHSLTGINIPAGVTSIGDSAFFSCSGLTGLALPEGLETIGSQAFYNCAGFRELRIPSTVTSLGSSFLYTYKWSSLKTLYWDAVNASVGSCSDCRDNRSFQLVLGPTVERFTTAQFAPLANAGCNSVVLPKENYLTLSALKADSLDMPLTSLPEALYYVDNQGALYRVDEENNEAHLAYCPAGLDNYTVPAQIPDTDGHGPFDVVGVDRYAFNTATLSALTFAAPENITGLQDFAFYNAKNLASINGKTKDTEVLALFPNLGKPGGSLFENTKIAHDSPVTDGEIIKEKDNLVLTISTAPSTNLGDHRFYTGETAHTSIAISNPTDQAPPGAVVRLYYRMDSAEGKLNYEPGKTYQIQTDKGSEITMTVSETSIPYCYCLELTRPAEGETVDIELRGIYPSPTSGGGTATVWGAILTEQEANALGDALAPMKDGSHFISWETKRDEFPVTKTLKSTGSAKLTGNGKGGAYLAGLSYEIGMKRDGPTLQGMGKDYMAAADYVDVLTLPEGAQLNDAVLQAIRDNTYTVYRNFEATWSDDYKIEFKLPDGTVFLTFKTIPTKHMNADATEEFSLSLDAKENPQVHWTYINDSTSEEIDATTVTLSFADDCVEFKKVPEGKDKIEVTNDVVVTQHFTHSGDVVKEDQCSVTASILQGSLQPGKTFGRQYGTYWGESSPLTLTLRNPGTGDSPAVTKLEDPMPDLLYMSAEQLAEAFRADQTDKQLTVTIANATLCAPLASRQVIGTDGVTIGQTTQQDTGAGTRYDGMSSEDPAQQQTGCTITLSWGDDGNLLITQGTESVSCAPDGPAIQNVLDAWGYLVTRAAQYTLTWDLTNADGSPRVLVGGEVIEKNLNITVKDTFMQLNGDKLHSIGTNSISGSVRTNNNLYAYLAAGGVKSATTYIDSSQDFWLTKGWSMDGKTVEPDAKLAQGDVLDYQLQFNHRGKAHYDALPLTDHLEGGQALLAPVALNQNEAWAAACPTVTLADGSQYYILKEAKTYSRVWTDQDHMADTVTVAKTDSGLDTVIKWYFTDYTTTTSYSSGRTDTVKYHAMVCPADVCPDSLSFSVDNETWLGDHESHRLYNNIPGWWGAAVAFDKKIVDQVGDTGGWVHSTVKEDSAVVYRLTVYGTVDEEGNYHEMTLTGQYLYDVLPNSIENWRWTRDGDAPNVAIAYGDGLTVTNGDHWSVTEAEGNRQEIRWDDDFSMTFKGRADIYVTLNFPVGEPWVDYANEYGSTGLVNTFHLLGGQTSVTHDLSIQGQVRLQKGVYSSCYYGASMSGQTDALWYYSNAGGEGGYLVEYYVSLYNGGRTNLFLTDMQDRLPRGFTFNYAPNGTETHSSPVANVYKADGSQAKYVDVDYKLTTLKKQDGTQFLNIHFTPAQKDYWSPNPASYDEDRDLCYLKPGEAIVITYRCSTGAKPDTDPAALNIVTMPYYDFNGGGVTLDTGSKTTLNQSKYKPNDGGCDLENTGAMNGLGFVGGEAGTQWLTSQVTVSRGDIRPGITKALLSATDINHNVTENPVAVQSGDTLKWQVTAENDGAYGLENYVLTDVMQAPYRFIGSVNYKTPMFDEKLFEIQEWNGDKINVQIRTGYYFYDNITCTLGKPFTAYVCLYNEDIPLKAVISKDAATGDMTLSIKFEDPFFVIPAGGSGVLTLSTKNYTSTLQNDQFFNNAYITPMAQTWDNTTNKGNVIDFQTPYAAVAMPTVRNSAQVSTAFGYATSSIKHIEEIADPTNCAASTDDRNYIALADKANQFTYTLTINNVNERAMDKLILIDRLPEVGDHTVFDKDNKRESQFKVSLTDTPNFTVTVKSKDGTIKTLTQGTDYTLDFSDKTEFEDADWQGNGANWETSLRNHRTLRLIIDQPNNSDLIPPESSISLSFNCKVDDPNAQPGDIAWNAFGYLYSMDHSSTELQAAPLKVGVKIPTVPKLTKKLVDHQGAAITAKKDESFSFLVYTGDALTGTWETADQLKTALTADGRAFREFSLTVPSGKSESAPLMLPKEDAAGWKWVKGNSYTVVELPDPNSDYAFRNFGVGTTNAYTFTYAPAEDQFITCSNVGKIWTVDLTKAEPAADDTADDKPLEGAVFALYSPSQLDQLTGELPAEYAGLGIGKTIEQDGATWYLKGVQTTDENGKCAWKDLNQQRYCLLEVKAPDGYKLPKENPRLLNCEEERQGVLSLTVYNYIGEHELPLSGGVGLWSYTVGGLALMGAGLFLLRRQRRQKGGGLPRRA